MEFSVVTPTHNRLPSLQKLLASLENQSLDKELFEVLVVPSPNDQSCDWLQKYAEKTNLNIRICVPPIDPYMGRSASFKRNYGAKAASATWLAFIDDDCVADTAWLSSAMALASDPEIHGIEGLTRIPMPPEPTLTFKGLKRLSTPGGFQTCNMFYRKSTFQEIGGFDLNFPFYLEDTDIAWSFLEKNKKLVFSEASIVEHPVPPAETKRLLHNAQRSRKLPYLYKKHPQLFKASHIRPLARIQWLYIFFYFAILVLFSTYPWATALLASVLGIFALTASYTAWQLRGCKFSTQELVQLLLYYPITPLIAFFQLIRGNWDQRTFIFF